MSPFNKEIQIQRDKDFARILELEGKVQTQAVKQEIKELNEALEIEPIKIEDEIISISPIKSLGNKEEDEILTYYNTTNFSVFEVLINIFGKLTKIYDIRPSDPTKYCGELSTAPTRPGIIDGPDEKAKLFNFYKNSGLVSFDFFGTYLTLKTFSLGEKSVSFPHKRLLALMMKYEYTSNTCYFSSDKYFNVDDTLETILEELFEFKVDKRFVVYFPFMFYKKKKYISGHSTLLISEYFPDPKTGVYKKKLIFYNPNSDNHIKYKTFSLFINRYYMDYYGHSRGETHVPFEWVFSNRISSVYRFSIQGILY